MTHLSVAKSMYMSQAQQSAAMASSGPMTELSIVTVLVSRRK